MDVRAYIEVLGVDLAMLGQVEVFLRDQHSFAEDVLVDLLAVFLGDQPDQNVISIGISFEWYSELTS